MLVGASEDVEADAGGRRAVSVWRKLFIANEWNDLQGDQAFSVEFTLFALMFFMRGINLEYLSASQPIVTNLTAGVAPVNIVLRFAVRRHVIYIKLMTFHDCRRHLKTKLIVCCFFR